MADRNTKKRENVPGKYFVDSECDACQVCISLAANNFCMDENDEYAYVCKQPSNPAEEEACREAMDGCPNEAIGDDGE